MDKVSVKFGTDGVRGIIDVSIHEFIVALVAEATLRHWASKYRARRVLVSYDTRRKSREYAGIIAYVAHRDGFDVSIVDSPTPTPVVSWAVRSMRYDLAFQVTASHNPPNYNGVKVIGGDGAPAQEEDTRRIEAMIDEEFDELARSIKDVEPAYINPVNVREGYVDYVASWLSGRFKPRPLKILVDPIFGAAAGYTAEVLRRIGFNVTEVNNINDPNFGGRHPNPEEANIREDVEAVLGGRFDMAIAHDGDGDRLAIVLPKVGYLNANRILPTYTLALANIGMVKRGVVRTVATTHLVDDLASSLGLKVYETPVGIKYVVKVLMEGGAEIGGEESGGLAYSWHIPEKDGVYSGSLGACIEGEYGLVNLYRDLVGKFGERFFDRVDIHVDNAKAFVEQNRQRIKERLAVLGKLERFVEIDGVKAVYGDKSWVLVRGSGTEPVVRIYSEALSEARVSELIGAVRSVLGI